MKICDELNMKNGHIIDDLPDTIHTHKFTSLIHVMDDMEKEIKLAMNMLNVIIKSNEKNRKVPTL